MTKVYINKSNLIKKFLNPNNVDIDRIEKVLPVLQLPPQALKLFNEEDIKLVNQLYKFSTVEEFSSLNPADPFEPFHFLEEYQDTIESIVNQAPGFKEKIEKAVIISHLLKSLSEKKLNIENKQKILVIGLDNAGKTAIISKLGGKLGLDELASLKPTKGIERKEIKTKQMNLIIWDFGGHILYRDRHLTNEENFICTDLLIYVIDIQDRDKFADSLTYFKNIIDLFSKIEENPQIIVLIHKYDPDVRNLPEINLSLEFLNEEINNFLDNKNYDFEVYLSSIYSTFSNDPALSNLIKNLINDPESFIYESDPTWNKIKNLGDTIKKTLNAVINLAEYCNKLENRINDIESKNINTHLQYQKPNFGLTQNIQNTQSALPGHPPDPPQPPNADQNDTNPLIGRARAKDAIMNELREVFAKRKGFEEF